MPVPVEVKPPMLAFTRLFRVVGKKRSQQAGTWCKAVPVPVVLAVVVGASSCTLPTLMPTHNTFILPKLALPIEVEW